MDRLRLIKKYIRNNRLEEYDNILHTAVERRYSLISLRDSIGMNHSSAKVLILRHDIDHISKATKMMFEIEKKYNAHASYYFRKNTIDVNLMKEIESYGSESSFHFETIAEYIKRHKLKKGELSRIDFVPECVALLKKDLETMRDTMNLPFETIASHGAPENQFFGIPNNYLTEDIKTVHDLGIKLEAYNKEFINSLSVYISDCPMEINEGYLYGIHPLEAIKKNEKRILFLTHPNHWHYNWYGRIRKACKITIKGAIYENQTFKRI